MNLPFEIHEAAGQIKNKIAIFSYCSYPIYETYNRFAGSLYDTGFNGPVHFFAEEKYRDTLLKIEKKYDKVSYQKTSLKPYVRRYEVYLKFLEENKIEVDYIFLTDGVDVLFQKNMEEYPLPKGYDLFLFNEDKKVGKSNPARRNYRRLHGPFCAPDFFNKTKDKTIICAGTVLGTTKGIKKYLELYCLHLDKLPPRHQFLRRTGEQSVLNYMYHYSNVINENINTKLLTNKDNLVNTLGYGHKEVVKDKIVNEEGEVSYIVHQYNCLSAEQKSKISNKYDFTFKHS
jgi:hypothetical protein